MAEGEEAKKLYELDRLLNAPDVPMRADRVWELLDELSGKAGRQRTLGSSLAFTQV